MSKTVEIKIGDYIEGVEQWGNEAIPEYGIKSTLRSHKMRLIVQNIYEYNGVKKYYGKADDSWGGARGGTISEDLGPIRVITEEEPFTRRWWEPKTLNVLLKTNESKFRDWKIGDKVRRYDGKEFEITNIALNPETQMNFIIYTDIITKQVYALTRQKFESAVNKEDYPQSEQDWIFEIIE